MNRTVAGSVEERYAYLAKSPEDVAGLGLDDRVDRVRWLLNMAHEIVDEALRVHLDGHRLAGRVVLFSGGNDSTVLAHIFRREATHAAHANTGIGIEQTRQFVRDTCQLWDLPLLEKHPPPGSTYRELVLDQGFPGPAHHWKMYQRLKERCLRQVRKDLVQSPHRERVLFLAGRRRTESARRTNVPMHERVGSVIWASPLVLWTKLDLNTYRWMYGDVPTNEVTDMIHMSGECLCGAFAHPGELDEIGMWFPDVRREIEALEAEVAAVGQVRCRWGWARAQGAAEAKSGPMCSSCDARVNP